MSGELCFPLAQPVLASPADNARRKARRSSWGNLSEFQMKWLRRSSQMTIIFRVDEEIDSLSSGLQIDETNTSPAVVQSLPVSQKTTPGAMVMKMVRS